MKAQGKNPSIRDLILCNILGIHNRRRQSLTGAVHYCSRCGIVTRDNRKHRLQVADVKKFEPGSRIIFGGCQEYSSLVTSVDLETDTVVISQGVVVSKWRSRFDSTVRALHRLSPWWWVH